MKKVLALSILMLSVIGLRSQESPDIKKTSINRKVSGYSLAIDMETPLKSFLSMQYILTTGKQNLWSEISSFQLKNSVSDSNAPDKAVTEEAKKRELNMLIEEVVTYKDSVAAVIYRGASQSERYIYWCGLENGKWKNMGQDLGGTSEETLQKVKTQQEKNLKKLNISKRLQKLPANTGIFAEYIKTNGISPQDYLLKKLSGNKIVIYGELHRRRISWDLLKTVIQNPLFVKTTGTVFMELPSHAQQRIDAIFSEDVLNTEKLLDIFRDEQIIGWYDKGEYEFIVELWNLNKRLPDAQKIRIILADYQAPFSEIKNRQEFEDYPVVGRNTHMADIIERHMKSTTDTRNGLFIVGLLHAYKSDAVQYVYTNQGREEELSAGAQLNLRFPGTIFSIIQHIPSISNSGRLNGLVRGGTFDKAFKMNENIPVAFDLKGSPFGNEPFDSEISLIYREETQDYENNYDGYIFFGPLKIEKDEYLLYEAITPEFVDEIKRRIGYFDPQGRQRWFGPDYKAEELDAKILKDYLKRKSEGRKRWEQLFED